MLGAYDNPAEDSDVEERVEYTAWSLATMAYEWKDGMHLSPDDPSLVTLHGVQITSLPI